eukprot:TRINITY_DN28614_c0_g1_i1.p1 TRINITY_DN28614_c0_g1~~TRINITY_DN28614_c0_g1_i1.p1  ORF type:complete len:481 (+),score=88.88 TRINITY_DN28614_c0_g1_i1:75-1517(+)
MQRLPVQRLTTAASSLSRAPLLRRRCPSLHWAPAVRVCPASGRSCSSSSQARTEPSTAAGSEKESQDDGISPLQVVAMLLGSAAMAFAAKGAWGLQEEVHKLQDLFHRHTTLEDLERTLQKDGEAALPKLCIVTGYLRAGGARVKPFLTKSDKDFAISGLLVTRQSCLSHVEQKQVSGVSEISADMLKDLPANTLVERYPRALEHNVLAARRVAADLQLAGEHGRAACIRLPPLEEVFKAEVPTLYRSVTDLLREARLHLETGPQFGEHVVGATSDLMGEHLLSFLTTNTVSDTDDGRVGSRDFLAECGKAVGDAAKWSWHPAGYYDCCEADAGPSWASFAEASDVGYKDFRARLEKAASENTKLSPLVSAAAKQTPPKRDAEYGFRFLEFDIQDGEPVTVLARPVASKQGSQTVITLAPPDEEIDGHHYRFRILHGHTVEDAIRRRRTSEYQYCGIGAGGALLSAWGLMGLRFLTRGRV